MKSVSYRYVCGRICHCWKAATNGLNDEKYKLCTTFRNNQSVPSSVANFFLQRYTHSGFQSRVSVQNYINNDNRNGKSGKETNLILKAGTKKSERRSELNENLIRIAVPKVRLSKTRPVVNSK